jgi:two-component system LytT family sensor kinase
MHKKTLYWLCQIIGWILYTIFSLAMIAIFGGTSSLTTSTIQLQLIILIVLVGMSHVFRLYIIRKQWVSLKTIRLIPRVVIGTLILSIISQGIIHILIYVLIPLDGIAAFNLSAFIAYIFNVYVVFILWSAIYFFIKFTQKNSKNEIEKLELKSALQEAELMILKNQINPHFLFNALNNIRSLILSDQDRARQMVTHISELLRYSIQFNASEKVTLAEEINIVEDYLQLESIQFDDRLAYVMNIADDTTELSIPPMAIQLLVENAIKHGLSIQKNGGFIRIESSKVDNELVIKVTNTGQLGQKKGREGIGLKNLLERMKILFGPFAQFQLENSTDDTVTATLNIPIQ